jgi:hypothetical protein
LNSNARNKTEIKNVFTEETVQFNVLNLPPNNAVPQHGPMAMVGNEADHDGDDDNGEGREWW